MKRRNFLKILGFGLIAPKAAFSVTANVTGVKLRTEPLCYTEHPGAWSNTGLSEPLSARSLELARAAIRHRELFAVRIFNNG